MVEMGAFTLLLGRARQVHDEKHNPCNHRGEQRIHHLLESMSVLKLPGNDSEEELLAGSALVEGSVSGKGGRLEGSIGISIAFAFDDLVSFSSFDQRPRRSLSSATRMSDFFTWMCRFGFGCCREALGRRLRRTKRKRRTRVVTPAVAATGMAAGGSTIDGRLASFLISRTRSRGSADEADCTVSDEKKLENVNDAYKSAT